MQSRSRVWIGLAAAGIIAAVAALLLVKEPEPPHAALRPVRLHTNAYPLSALLYIAADRGFFQRHGLGVTLTETPTGRDAVANLVAGEADVAVAADIVIALNILTGKPLTIVATLGEAHGGHGLVARRDKGIATLQHLHAKRIGVAIGTSGHYYLYGALVRAGIDPRQVSTVDAPPDRQIAMLTAGDVDAVATWDPLLQKASVELGPGGVTLSSPVPARLIWNLVVTKQYLEREPATVQALLSALLEAESFLRENPARALEIVAARLGVDARMFRQDWRSYRAELALDQSLLLSLESISRWAIATGQVPAVGDVPNYLQHVDRTLLKKIKPKGVAFVD